MNSFDNFDTLHVLALMRHMIYVLFPMIFSCRSDFGYIWPALVSVVFSGIVNDIFGYIYLIFIFTKYYYSIHGGGFLL